MIRIMPSSILRFVMPLGTGLDQSARGLAALRYEELPVVTQVVRGAQSASWQSPSSQSDCEANRREEERAPTRKMAKDLKHEHSVRRPPTFLKQKADS